MHIPEKRVASKRLITWLVLIVTSLIVLFFIWQYLNKNSRQVNVSRDELIIATVEQGDLLREVRAPGKFVPIEANFIAATSSGRVKRVLLHASDEVDVGSTIMELENPQLSQMVTEAKLDIEVLKAQYHALVQKWQQMTLKQKIVVADFNARYAMAKLREKANQSLVDTGAVSSIDHEESIVMSQQLKIQSQLEFELLQSLPKMQAAELLAAQAKIDKAQGLLALQEQLADELYVKATSKGVIQDVSVQAGESFRTGAVLARVAGKNNLKAQLNVQESQVKDVRKGQTVIVKVNGRQAQGYVQRINPVVQLGVVNVDVHFDDDIFKDARADMRIEGIIELEHITDVLKIKRPVFSQEYSARSLFVVNPTATEAERKLITFGRSSVDDIEIVSPLKVGQKVVVSSTQKYSEINKISLR